MISIMSVNPTTIYDISKKSKENKKYGVFYITSPKTLEYRKNKDRHIFSVGEMHVFDKKPEIYLSDWRSYPGKASRSIISTHRHSSANAFGMRPPKTITVVGNTNKRNFKKKIVKNIRQNYIEFYSRKKRHEN